MSGTLQLSLNVYDNIKNGNVERVTKATTRSKGKKELKITHWSSTQRTISATEGGLHAAGPLTCVRMH